MNWFTILKRAKSKYADPKNLSKKKQKLLQSKPSFDVKFPKYSYPDGELDEVIRISRNKPKDMENLDKNNNQMMLDVVGEKMSDWKDVIEDIDIHTIKLKMQYGRPRPYEVTDKIDSITNTDNSPSFPSGHATEAYALAKILSKQYPEKKEQLYKLASKIALSRVQMGNHYPSDIETGKKVGNLIADAYLEAKE